MGYTTFNYTNQLSWRRTPCENAATSLAVATISFDLVTARNSPLVLRRTAALCEDGVLGRRPIDEGAGSGFPFWLTLFH